MHRHRASVAMGRGCSAGVIAALLLITIPLEAAEPSRSETAHTSTSTSAGVSLPLTDHERVRATHWHLSVDDWQRYRTLMDGIRGSISPATLSPIEVLGIHARDSAERRRYAEQWALMMREDAERILAFQHAYDEASQQLFPNETLIDVARLPSRIGRYDALRRTDRVLLFVRPDCGACDALLARVLASIDRLAGVDVFLSGIAAGDDTAIRAWAIDRGIRPEWVNAQRVTLNFEGGVLERVAPGRDDLPVLLRRRGDTVTPLARGAL